MQIPNIIIFKKNVCCTEKYILKHYPKFHQYLSKEYPKDISFSEKMYWYYNNIMVYPLCKCGEKLKFLSISRGYSKFCSKKCSMNDESVKNRVRQTNIVKYGGMGTASPILNSKKIETTKKRYGVETAMLSPVVQNKKNKTCLERYGVPHILQSKGIAPKIQDRIKQTNLDKYGVEYGFQSPTIQQKSKDTIKTRYGVDNVMYLDDMKDKMRNTIKTRYGVDNVMYLDDMRDKMRNTIKNKIIDLNPDILDVSYYADYKLTRYKCICPHKNCTKCQERFFQIHPSNYWYRKHYNMEICTTLNPIIEKKLKGTWIENYICNILDSLNISYIRNNRSVIFPKELDIYIPEIKLAIECNGDYWHSLKDKKYHSEKLNSCHSKGIEMLSIWEDQVIHNRKYLENLVRAKFITNSIELNYHLIPNNIARLFIKKYGCAKIHKSAHYLGVYNKECLSGVIGYNIKNNTVTINQIWEKFNSFITNEILSDIKYIFRDQHVYILLDNDIGYTLKMLKLGYKLDETYQCIRSNYILPNSYKRLNSKPNSPHYRIYNSGVSKFIIK